MNQLKFILFLLLCILFILSGNSQEQKIKNITAEDYHKWYHLGLPVVSSKGTWIGYKLNYPKGEDTLIIKNTTVDKEHVFPGGSNFPFIGEKWAIYKDIDQLFHLLNLISQKQEVFPDATQIIVNDNENFLILFKKEKKEIIIRSLINYTEKRFKGVYDFYYDIETDSILLYLKTKSGYAAGIVGLENSLKLNKIIEPQPRKVTKIKSVAHKNCFVYALGSIKVDNDTLDSGILGYYNLKKNKRSELNLTKADGFPKDYSLTTSREFQLRVSKDGENIYFQYKRKVPLRPSEVPEVWKWNDPYIYKKMAYQMNGLNSNMIGIWNIKKNEFSKLTTIKHPRAILNTNQEFSLLYNPSTYEPQPRSYPPIDLYLKNLKTGQKSLLLKEHHNALYSLFFSPSGHKVVYFNEGSWWYYDIKSDNHINLNHKLNTIRQEPITYATAHESLPPGWTEGEKSIYMYDEFDLWEVPLGKGKPIRITFGREKGLRYKLLTTPKLDPFDKYHMGVYTKGQKLLFFIDAEDRMKYGYAIKDPGQYPKYVSIKNSYLSMRSLVTSKDGSLIAFLEENNAVPPRIMTYNIQSEKLDTIFQSNQHYWRYKHGKSKKVYYTNRKGKQLSGILRYPVDYSKDSLYPMIVRIYETQSQHYHQYTNPGYYNSVGYNPTNLVNKGYFVFLPDIEYTIGEPGFSAVDCIISGTKAAIRSASINSDKIALIGHSFGGYETLFAITQTNLFTTAIAGSSNSSLTRNYLYIDDNVRLNFERFEYGQSRMGKSLFDDYQGYLDNSPLYHAQSIQTPILIWSGNKDYHVHYYQSISFFLALKRMGKESVLLLYPDEAHTLLKKANQKDLTIKTEEWFNSYLKDTSKKKWMF